MLPLLRIIPVGGVFFAIMIVTLALNPPGDTRRSLSQASANARGVLVDAGDHPEWRQFLIHAAVRRADELDRLRELPDTPVRVPQVTVDVPADVPADVPIDLEAEAPPPAAAEPAVVAGLPADRVDADPDPEDVTGSIAERPGATIPIEIGETSSTELPVIPLPEAPPAIRMPERSRPLDESRGKPVQRTRRARAPATPAPPPTPAPNVLEALFGALQGKPQLNGAAQPGGPQKTKPGDQK
jgi:hypothetical protein